MPGMTVAELIAALRDLPGDALVTIPADDGEAGMDDVTQARLIDVVKNEAHHSDSGSSRYWDGQYLWFDADDPLDVENYGHLERIKAVFIS